MNKYHGLMKKGLELMGAVIVLLTLWANWAGAVTTITTDNLLVNPGAEEGTTTGWSADSTFLAYGAITCEGQTITTYAGNRLFYFGEQGASSNAWQWVDISNYMTNKMLVGSITAKITGVVSTYNDEVSPILYFYGSSTEITSHYTTYKPCMTWSSFDISAVVPANAQQIKILVRTNRPSGQNWNWSVFDDMKLTLTYSEKESKIKVIEPADGRHDFGNIYVDINGSIREFNKSKKMTIKFENNGDVPVNWDIPQSTWWVRFSKNQGTLGTGSTDSIELVPLDRISGPSHFNNMLQINNNKDAVRLLSTSYNPAEVSYYWPRKGTNEKVNVGLNGSVIFNVMSSTPSFPGAKVTGYGWKRSDKLSDDEISKLTPADFDVTSDANKCYTFSDLGNHIIYAASLETVEGKKILGRLTNIPVHVWVLPKVDDKPGTTNPSYWRNDKYVGVKDQFVYLRAAGVTGNNGDSSENVEKFIWDFDNDWDTIEKEQIATESVSHTWNKANLNNKIRCKAVTNYGIQSAEQAFDLKIYEPVKVDAQGLYTGRPEKPVELKCSFNQTSYPGAAYKYQWYITDGYEKTVDTNDRGEAKYTWKKTGQYTVKAEVTITTEEGLKLTGYGYSSITIEAGKPTAIPGGPYRGGIFGGNFSPIQLEGNNPDFVEDTDIGHIDTWVWSFEDGGSANIWNPTKAYEKAGEYTISLKVRSEYGKWSDKKDARVKVIDGKIAGFVRASDLRTPVGSVTLSLTSSHVDKNVLRRIAMDNKKNLTAIGTSTVTLLTVTDNKGYYEFAHLPLGNYLIRASMGTGDAAHEFEKSIRETEITLSGPEQLAIDFVDISIYPVGGRVIYSIQKNGQDVLVEDVEIKAQSVSTVNPIEANPSKKSLSATGVNYSMPLLANKYLFLAKKQGHDVRIDEDTLGYDTNFQLVTVENARTNIDFIDYTTRKLTVFVEDSGGYSIGSKTVTISGDNGQAEG
ncbi:MAG: PKD domain-containing protein, partial [bacterium]